MVRLAVAGDSNHNRSYLWFGLVLEGCGMLGQGRQKVGFGTYWRPETGLTSDIRKHSGLVTGGKKTRPSAKVEGAIVINTAKGHGYRRQQVNKKSAFVMNLFTRRSRHHQNVDLIQELSKAQKKMHVTWKFIGMESSFRRVCNARGRETEGWF